jgi:ribosomal protein S18 acetylase RimI-like enzyme
MEIAIRPATQVDAAVVERLYQQSAAYLRALGDTTDFQFGARVYLRDGFGPEPSFAGLVALLDDDIIGYLLYTFGYDTDRAIRYLFVLDLLVDESRRRLGIGRRLMEEARLVCRRQGGAELVWAVYHNNSQALAFYERLGASRITDVVYMSLPA